MNVWVIVNQYNNLPEHLRSQLSVSKSFVDFVYVTTNGEVASMCKLAGAKVHLHPFHIHSNKKLDVQGLTLMRTYTWQRPVKYVYTTSDYTLALSVVADARCKSVSIHNDIMHDVQ